MNTQKENLYKYRMEKCKMMHRDIWNKISTAEDKGKDVKQLGALMEKNLGLLMYLKAKEIKNQTENINAGDEN